MWDDTYLHEVHNDSDRLRIVLLLDVQRRHMPLDLRLLSSLILKVAALEVRARLRA